MLLSLERTFNVLTPEEEQTTPTAEKTTPPKQQQQEPDSQQQQQQQSDQTPTPGSKRPREGEEGGEDGRPGDSSEAAKPDPTKAPDPEEPEGFDESEMAVLSGDQYEPPEDDSIITLDRCEPGGGGGGGYG